MNVDPSSKLGILNYTREAMPFCLLTQSIYFKMNKNGLNTTRNMSLVDLMNKLDTSQQINYTLHTTYYLIDGNLTSGT